MCVSPNSVDYASRASPSLFHLRAFPVPVSVLPISFPSIFPQFLPIPMLPRHLRRAVLTPSAPAQIRALLLSRNALQRHPLALPTLATRSPAAASFHSSSRRQNELPKSPFQTFVDVLKEELRKNRELQENVKQLQGDVDKFQDSEAMKRARAAYERARVRICSKYCQCIDSNALWSFS